MHRELRGSQRMLLTGSILIVLAAFSILVGMRSFQPKTFDFDLVAFYCGGDATAHGDDPYRTEPLRTCEHAIGSVFRPGTPAVVPDPLPAYDQALFALLSRMPYRALQVVWGAIEIGVFAVTVTLLARVCGLSRALVGCALVVSDFYCSGILGQLFPIALLGIVLSGWALERDRPRWLAVGLVAAMSEPHLGLPVLIAALVWGGRSRGAAAVAAGALAFVSVLALPFGVIVEYVARVVPAHALSEIDNQEQLSLAYAVHVLGGSPEFSLLLSKIGYAVSLAFGVAVAGRLAERFGRPMLAFAPAVFVLLAGPFLHVTQVAAALPAALFLAGRARSRPAGASVALLAVPWLDFSTVFTILPLAAAASYVTVRRVWRLDATRTIVVVAAAVASIVAAALYVALDGPSRIPAYGVVPASALAELTWKIVVDNDRHGHVVLFALAKIPTEIALWMLAGSLGYAAVGRSVRVVRGDAVVALPA